MGIKADGWFGNGTVSRLVESLPVQHGVVDPHAEFESFADRVEQTAGLEIAEHLRAFYYDLNADIREVPPMTHIHEAGTPDFIKDRQGVIHFSEAQSIIDIYQEVPFLNGGHINRIYHYLDDPAATSILVPEEKEIVPVEKLPGDFPFYLSNDRERLFDVEGNIAERSWNRSYLFRKGDYRGRRFFVTADNAVHEDRDPIESA